MTSSLETWRDEEPPSSSYQSPFDSFEGNVLGNTLILEEVLKFLPIQDLRTCCLVHPEWKEEAQKTMMRRYPWNVFIQSNPIVDFRLFVSNSCVTVMERFYTGEGSKLKYTEAVTRLFSQFNTAWLRHVCFWINVNNISAEQWEEDYEDAYNLVLSKLQFTKRLEICFNMPRVFIDPLSALPSQISLPKVEDLSLCILLNLPRSGYRSIADLPLEEKTQVFNRLLQFAPRVRRLGGVLNSPYTSWPLRLVKQTNTVHLCSHASVSNEAMDEPIYSYLNRIEDDQLLSLHQYLIVPMFENISELSLSFRNEGMRLVIHPSIISAILEKYANSLTSLGLGGLGFTDHYHQQHEQDEGREDIFVIIPILPRLRKLHFFCRYASYGEEWTESSPKFNFMTGNDSLRIQYAKQYPCLRQVKLEVIKFSQPFSSRLWRRIFSQVVCPEVSTWTQVEEFDFDQGMSLEEEDDRMEKLNCLEFKMNLLKIFPHLINSDQLSI